MAAEKRATILYLLALGAVACVGSFQLPHPIRPPPRQSTARVPGDRNALAAEAYNGPDGDSTRDAGGAGAATVVAAQRPESHEAVEDDESNGDTLMKLSKDVRTVLHDLRGSEFDSHLPKHLMGGASSLSYTKTWTLDDWELHNSRMRYFRYLLNFPRSRLMRRIWPQQTALLAWTLLTLLVEGRFAFLKGAHIPLSSLGTISTFVAFLLTLRSNHALARLYDARQLWSKVILNTREMATMVSTYIYPVDKQLALMLGRHLTLFGWLLKSQLRLTKRDDVVDLVRTMLPDKEDADYVLSQRQKTAAILARMRQVLYHLGERGQLSNAEEIAMDHRVHALGDVVTSTGRIRSFPIPTLYTSHSSRLLVFYLFCLPAALKASGLGGVTTTLITMVVGFAMNGLDEMSHMFEQPFRVVPMYDMSKRSMQAVADAFTCRPPALEGEVMDHEEGEGRLMQEDLTAYWSKVDIATMSDNLME